MKNSIKNIIFGVLIASAFHQSAKCENRKFVLINSSPKTITFIPELRTSPRDSWHPSIPLGAQGAWRLGVGSKGEIITVMQVHDGKSNYDNQHLIASENIKNYPDAYGIFFSYKDGKPTIEVCNEAETAARGYKWSDWDTGKR